MSRFSILVLSFALSVSPALGIAQTKARQAFQARLGQQRLSPA